MGAKPLDLQGDVHRRRNPLLDEWVLVSPHRTGRPWQGQTESTAVPPSLSYDPQCYLCPGNARASGAVNLRYESTYVFDNDFPALLPDSDAREFTEQPLLAARSESGHCRVICYSPLHHLSLGQMPVSGIRQVIDTWDSEYRQLAAQPNTGAVTIFENRGLMMGASNPHPHGQLWATQTIPDLLLRESKSQEQNVRDRKQCLLCEYAALESARRERIVLENEHFVVVVPFWATWPFETLVLPRHHATGLDEFDAPRRDAFALALKDLTRRYDSMFGAPFPYTMGLHQRPTIQGDHSHWHLHAHFYPPLLRSATVRKFMVGYEMLAGPQRDITPEVAAKRLRELP